MVWGDVRQNDQPTIVDGKFEHLLHFLFVSLNVLTIIEE
jgi:hypothetical protein